MDKHSIEEWFNHISVTVPSRGSGWRKMRCPYHDDSNASAAVNYDINRFKCHGCGVQGDTYDLIMKERGGTLVEAIEYAASVLATGNTTVRPRDRASREVSLNPGAVGRRGNHLSSGSGRRSTARS